MRQASILGPNQSIQNKFPPRNNFNDLTKDILNFVNLTQLNFALRTGLQERWEVNSRPWMQKNIDENFHLLQILNMTDSIKPLSVNWDALCILGATKKTMQRRMDFAELLIMNGINVKNLILLAGQRYVTIGENIDGTQNELDEISSFYQLPNTRNLTETHLIQYIYRKSKLYEKITTYVIDTPARDLPRPTTQTTILELTEWLKQHDEIKNILFISNQPYVKYQEAVINEVLRNEKIEINLDVVGPPIPDINNIQPIIESLGSYIFAKTPFVLSKLGKAIEDKELIESHRLLYRKYPLIYK